MNAIHRAPSLLNCIWRALPLRLGAALTTLATAVALAAGDAPPQGVVASPHAEPPSSLPRFRSVLDGYRRYRIDEPRTDWRMANETAGRLGGHAGQFGPTPDVPAAGHTATPHAEGSGR
ncbi:hypothetical protein [Aromatoleum evansii]|uniref:hypothetical protein n=1 Tax=Aromatoleum evansii TaxID=59406 RepID=UPI00145C5BE6|nr:hypothetical protein [Aromatoleum evansii]NMG32303.1 hypothetical protein [Aromatoleum evansii]